MGRQLTEELAFAISTGSKINLWDPPIFLANVPDKELTAEVLRRGDKLNLAELLASAPDKRLYRELSGRTLRLDLSEIADGELYRELGCRRQAKRKVRRGGSGRPRKPRCACGKLTLDAAARQSHVCGGRQVA